MKYISSSLWSNLRYSNNITFPLRKVRDYVSGRDWADAFDEAAAQIFFQTGQGRRFGFLGRSENTDQFADINGKRSTHGRAIALSGSPGAWVDRVRRYAVAAIQSQFCRSHELAGR